MPSTPQGMNMNLFKRMSPGAQFLFLAGVFFLFAPLIPLQVTPADGTRLTGILIPFVASGIIGAVWAATGTVSTKFIPLAILLTSLPVLGFVVIKDGVLWMRPGEVNLIGIGATISVSLGYTLFLFFIGVVGKNAVRLETEMQLAKQIHDRLVPDLSFQTPQYQIFARSRASSEMGGDMVCTATHDDTLDAIVADVSGHGVAAGVVMAMIRAVVESSASDEIKPLDQLVARLNTVLHDLTEPNMFATLAAIRIAHDTPIQCIIAGHPPAILCRANGATQRIDSTALPAGVITHTPFPHSSITLNKGDYLAIYTDGCIETRPDRPPKGAPLDLFGIDRLEALLAHNQSKPLEQIADAIESATRAHGPQADDETILLIRATA